MGSNGEISKFTSNGGEALATRSEWVSHMICCGTALGIDYSRSHIDIAANITKKRRL